jgi:hypothetical protein
LGFRSVNGSGLHFGGEVRIERAQPFRDRDAGTAAPAEFFADHVPAGA